MELQSLMAEGKKKRLWYWFFVLKRSTRSFESVWFPVAHRVYIYLPISMLQQALQDDLELVFR